MGRYLDQVNGAALDGAEWRSCRELLESLGENLLPKRAAEFGKSVISNEVRSRLREYGDELSFDELTSLGSLLYEHGDHEAETADVFAKALKTQADDLEWAIADIDTVEELGELEKAFVAMLDDHGLDTKKARRSFERRREALHEDDGGSVSTYGSLRASPPILSNDEEIKSMFHGLRQRR